jgi:hypothetical protein
VPAHFPKGDVDRGLHRRGFVHDLRAHTAPLREAPHGREGGSRGKWQHLEGHLALERRHVLREGLLHVGLRGRHWGRLGPTDKVHYLTNHLVRRVAFIALLAFLRCRQSC